VHLNVARSQTLFLSRNTPPIKKTQHTHRHISDRHGLRNIDISRSKSVHKSVLPFPWGSVRIVHAKRAC